MLIERLKEVEKGGGVKRKNMCVRACDLASVAALVVSGMEKKITVRR